MPRFGKRSNKNLATADVKLQELFGEVVKYFDCSVIYGSRTKEEQFALYKQGRELIDGSWVKTGKQPTVTNCDGITILSNHNYSPSKAVDVMPYPQDWLDIRRFYMFVGFVRGIATLKGISIINGADWDGDTQVKDQTFNDLAHFELIN